MFLLKKRQLPTAEATGFLAGSLMNTCDIKGTSRPSYPTVLAQGDAMNQNSSLTAYFKSMGWDSTWDFDSHGRWLEVMHDGHIVIQVEEDTPLDDMIQTIKDLAKECGAKKIDFDKDTPRVVSELIKKNPPTKCFYIWPTGRTARIN